jgi:ABC-2 type transport system ATP-binding protein
MANGSGRAARPNSGRANARTMMSATNPSETDKTPALVVSGVSHSFGDTKVLDDVSLTVDQGAFVMLLGLNGAGKSTLFSLITRLYDNVSGQISIRGFDVRRRPSQALQRLGVVFQSRTLDIDLSLMQNLKYHAALHGFSNREATKRARQALELIGLADRGGEKVRSLSGGQTRRVEIARSMMHRPDLLLLDEATVGLDLGSRESVVKIVRDLVAKERLGVLWATHQMDEVMRTDQVVVLHKGVVLFNGTVPNLLSLTGATSVREAFRTITGTAAPVEEAA